MRIHLRLTPKASSNRIGPVHYSPDGQMQLSVYVTQIAENGKANAAMMRLLAAHFKVPISNIFIIKGIKTRNKLIQIHPKQTMA